MIAVTTLADGGPGSLREAVTAAGPRTVVFRVGGEIRLKSHLRVTEPFITIAGQTAPGDGITLRDAGFYIQTHDVVVRFIRSRVGASLVEAFDTQDALQISGDDAHDIVVDHCSFSWSIDECVGIRVPAHDVTFSWNVVSEALRQPFTKDEIGKERSHSMGLILSGGPTRCSVHHNLLADCNSRMPRIQGGRHAFVNNVVYDWGWLTGTFSREPEVNFIGNYYKRGPSSQALKAITQEADELGRVYVRGNRSPDRPNDTLPEWEPIVNAPAAGHQSAEPFAMPALTIQRAEEAYDAVLAGAGAILPARDAIDRRIVRQVRLGMGVKIDRPEQIADCGSTPATQSDAANPQSAEVPRDRDGDGMPDDWEVAQGFDPVEPADGASDADGDGYSNLEEYLHRLVEVRTIPRPAIRHMCYGKKAPAIRVSAGDVELPVLEVPRAAGLSKLPVTYYAHAWFDGEHRITVRVPGRDLSHATIDPKRYRDQVEARADAISFRVNEEGPRVIRLGPERDAPRLLAFFDAAKREPNLEHRNVLDVRRYGLTGNRAEATEKLQLALDDCAADAECDTVLIPSGEHRIGRVNVPSGVTLYLGRSSVLIADSEGTGDDSAEGAIVFENVHDAGLAGPGVIDGGGSATSRRRALVTLRGSRAVRIRDVVMRDGHALGRVGIDVQACEDVQIERVKVMTMGAGLVVNGSRDMRCSRCFLSGLMQGIVIASDAAGGSSMTDDVSVRETVVFDVSEAVSIGGVTRGPIRNVRMRNCDIVDAAGGLSIEERGVGGISGVVFQDMTMRLWRGWITLDSAGVPFHVSNVPQNAGVEIRDVLFDRVETNALRESGVDAFEGNWVSDIKFWGVRVRAEGGFWQNGPHGYPPLFTLERVRDPQFRFLHVAWPNELKELPSLPELVRTGDVENLKMPAEEVFQQKAATSPP